MKCYEGPSSPLTLMTVCTDIYDSANLFKIEQPVISGRPYESAVTPLGKCILRGLFSKNRY